MGSAPLAAGASDPGGLRPSFRVADVVAPWATDYDSEATQSMRVLANNGGSMACMKWPMAGNDW
jgi:hypothetical protein